jgi:hypothetical protein
MRRLVHAREIALREENCSVSAHFANGAPYLIESDCALLHDAVL